MNTPTVTRFPAECIARALGGTFVRINPDFPQVPEDLYERGHAVELKEGWQVLEDIADAIAHGNLDTGVRSRAVRVAGSRTLTTGSSHKHWRSLLRNLKS